jgi:predicted phage terminase large subunit-like protein
MTERLSAYQPSVDQSVLDEARACEASLKTFLERIWPILEGTRDFSPNWHIDAICDHLEAVYRGEIRKLIINIPPRCGKPVGEDTLLLTDKATRVKIKDICVGDRVLTGKGRFKSVLQKFDQGILPTIKIKTFGGREVVAALDHPFLTPCGWVEAKDLRVRDVLGLSVPSHDFGECLLPEEARLMGYLIGDGCLVGNSAVITVSDEIEKEDLEICCKKLGFVIKFQSYDMKNKPSHHCQTLTRACLSAGTRSVRDWMRNHGISDKNSYTKLVPEKVMKGDFKTIQNFLGAYFACDGCMENKGPGRGDALISISSVSKQILEQCQHLFQRLGIRSKIRTKVSNIKTKKQGDKYISYVLDLRDQDDMYHFNRLIPVHHAKGQKIRDKSSIRHNFDNAILPDEIVSIEENGLVHCYCVEIEEDGTFTANDLIVHNSSLVSVAFPIWCWIKNPELQFLYISYIAKLAIKDSVKCRRVIDSYWFQQHFGHKFKLAGDVNSKTRFDNNKSGHRIATSVGSGGVTGDGADIIVLDDPNNAHDVMSDVKREGTNEWADFTLSTRLNDQKTGRVIIVQQRLHAQDYTGHVLDKDLPDLVHLMLPMEFDVSRKCFTVPLPGTDGKPWCDPRKDEGELLWPARIGEKELESLKAEMNDPYVVSGQLQQSPSPQEGGIIKKEWFQWWKEPEKPRFEFLLQSWDTALSTKPTACYSTCTTWGVFKDQHGVSHVILASRWRGRVEYPDLRRMAIRLARFIYDTRYDVPAPEDYILRPHMILVEAKANGLSLIQDLNRAGLIVNRFDPNKNMGDKVARLRLCTSILEAGRVWLPARGPNFTSLVPYAAEFLQSCLLFPNDESNDDVDSMSQALIKLMSNGAIGNPDDEVIRSPYKEKRALY